MKQQKFPLVVVTAVSISLLGACTMESEDPIVDDELDAAQPSPHETADSVDARIDPSQLGSESVVVLTGGCSGVLLNPHTIATVEHCLPIDPGADLQARAQPATLVELEVRGGPDAQRCLTPAADGACATWSLSIARQSATELVLLQSDVAFADVDPEQLPVLALDDAETGFAHGFAFASPIDDIDRARWQSSPTRLAQHDEHYRYGITPAGVQACGIDSGGPLLGVSQEADSAALLGLLSAAQYQVDAPTCLAEGGLERWVRLDPAFVQAHSSGCVETDAGLDCRFADLRTPAPEELELAPPVTANTFRSLGIDLIDPAERTPEQIDAEGLVGLALPDGNYLVSPAQLRQLDGSPEDVDFEGTAAGGEFDTGEMVPLTLRTRESLDPYALALNGNGDQRDEFFVREAGNLRQDSGTSSGCTGALIGKRIVRTAKHCTEDVSRPWFTVRYNGGPTTWTFDGGQTWVTFSPRQSSFHYYGGSYYNLGCDQVGGYTSSCIPKDWALLVMPEDVWNPVNVVPSYMGISTPYLLAAVGQTGLPSCSDISSPLISSCQTGIQYGMSLCFIMENNGHHYYTNCDVSPGHSGGPTFTTSNGTRYLVGHHVAGPSNGCGSTCQAVDTGTDSWLLDFQLDLRSTYSAVTL